MLTKKEIRKVVGQIEKLLNTPIPHTPEIQQGRVMYVPLPGSKKTAKHILSPRAYEVLQTLVALKRATSAQLQAKLGVNRNVVAGALHELRKAQMLKSESID